jgi:hypothetical protein
MRSSAFGVAAASLALLAAAGVDAETVRAAPDDQPAAEQAAKGSEANAGKGGEEGGEKGGEKGGQKGGKQRDKAKGGEKRGDEAIGLLDRARGTLGIRPAAPISLAERWSLLLRTILPVVYQPDPLSMTTGTSGPGDLDINPTLFLSPAKPGKVIWGAGVAAVMPLGTQPSLTAGRWSAGPSVVVLAQPRSWTIGALASQVWSPAGVAGGPDVATFTLQYFITYKLPAEWYLTSQPVLTADWEASGQQWRVPFGGGVGKRFKLGKLPVNTQLSAYHYTVRPDMPPSPDWQLRFQVAFLFPR